MNEVWTRKSLGEVCEILDSRRKPITKRNRVAGPYPYYGATGVLDYVDGYIFDERLVLVGEDGAKWGAGDNTAYAVEGKCWVNNHAHVIRTNQNVVLDSWVIYYLNAMDLAPFISGLTVPKLNQRRLREIPVPLPSIHDQKRIVAILDEAFSGINTVVANTEKNLANARELFECYLSSVFSQRGRGWSVKAVGDFSQHCLGKMLDKQKNKGVMKKYLRNVNVRWFEISTNDMLKMKIEEHEEGRYSVQAGDLLICEGGYPGRAAIWQKDEEVYFQKALHRVRCDDKRYNRWLLYYLYFLDSRGQLSQHFTGAGIQHFTGKALKAFPVPLAPPNILDKLLSGVESVHEEIRSLEAIYQQKLYALAELKQSLLQKAFSGELTAREAEAAVEEATA